jgi:carbonic anhydrase
LRLSGSAEGTPFGNGLLRIRRWRQVHQPISTWQWRVVGRGRSGQIAAETGIRPPFALEAFADADDDVRQSIARIKASAFIPKKDKIRGFVYEVESGRLRPVSE